MSITFGDYLIDSGYYDITPEQERDIEKLPCEMCAGSKWKSACPECDGTGYYTPDVSDTSQLGNSQ